jgi:hypothetical protein
MDKAPLNDATQRIRDYTAGHSELRAAHHFLYDLPLDKSAPSPKFVVMGINPGETERCRRAHPGPTEETRDFDFHEQSPLGRSRGSINWRKHAADFANSRAVVFTELFFWSSKDKDEFKERYGRLWESPHLAFCVEQNKALIETHKPSGVIFVGISGCEKVAEAFGLETVDTVKEDNSRLVVHYRDQYRPWFFTKHWTGSFGFSNAQKAAIKEYIQRAV